MTYKAFRFKQPFFDVLFVLIWTMWCSLVFAVLCILFFPLFFIGINLPSRRIKRLMHFFPVVLAKIALFLWGVRVEIYGKEKIDKEKQYIFSGNHRSYIDALVTAVISDNYKKYIGKAEILKYPVLGYLLKKIYVPVQRDDKASRKWSMQAMHTYLQDGASMVILPEGTCNTSHELLSEFKDGAFHLSTQMGIPIAVFTILGAAEIMPRKLLSIRPGKIVVYWEKVIIPASSDIDQVYTLKKEVQDILIHRLEEHYPNGYKYGS